jgi:hypothetical protein
MPDPHLKGKSQERDRWSLDNSAIKLAVRLVDVLVQVICQDSPS